MSTVDRLKKRLAEAGVAVDDAGVVLMVRHLEAVMEANQRMNLTAIRDLDTAMSLHIIDSLTPVGELAEAPEGPLVDLGSGAGFPGVPLAIVSGRQTTLVESIAKKARYLEDTVRSLGLDRQIRVFAGRAEALARQEAGLSAAVTARAVASLPALVELASPLLSAGGKLFAMKGKPEPSELEAGRAAAGLTGMEFEGVRTYELVGREDARSCVVFRKCGDSSVPLPRRDGVAQHRPLA